MHWFSDFIFPEQFCHWSLVIFIFEKKSSVKSQMKDEAVYN